MSLPTLLGCPSICHIFWNMTSQRSNVQVTTTYITFSHNSRIDMLSQDYTQMAGYNDMLLVEHGESMFQKLKLL